MASSAPPGNMERNHMLITQSKLIEELADGTRSAAEIAAAVATPTAPVSRCAVIAWITRHGNGKMRLLDRAPKPPPPPKPKVERRARPYPHQNRTRKPLAKAPAPLPEIPTTPTASLIELGTLSCRWPMWPHSERPPAANVKGFCGLEVENIDGKALGQPYCRAHKRKEWERILAWNATG